MLLHNSPLPFSILFCVQIHDLCGRHQWCSLLSGFWLGGSGGQRVGGEWGLLIYSPGPSCRVATGWLCPSPKGYSFCQPPVRTHLWVLVTSPSPSFRPWTITAPHCCQRWNTAPSLQVSLNPAHRFVNSPLIKLSSNYSS